MNTYRSLISKGVFQYFSNRVTGSTFFGSQRSHILVSATYSSFDKSDCHQHSRQLVTSCKSCKPFTFDRNLKISKRIQSSQLLKGHSCCYSQNSSDHDRNEDENEVKGVVLHVPNPINVFRNKLNSWRIQYTYDPEFSLEEFTEGAKQAASMLSQLLSKQDFDGMVDLVGTEAIDVLQEITHDWTGDQKKAVSFQVNDIHLATSKITRFFYDSDEEGHMLDIDVFIVAFKSVEKIPLLIEANLRMSRSFYKDSVSDWLISKLSHFNVKEFKEVEQNS